MCLRPFGSESVAQYLKKVLDQHNCTEDNLQYHVLIVFSILLGNEG